MGSAWRSKILKTFIFFPLLCLALSSSSWSKLMFTFIRLIESTINNGYCVIAKKKRMKILNLKSLKLNDAYDICLWFLEVSVGICMTAIVWAHFFLNHFTFVSFPLLHLFRCLLTFFPCNRVRYIVEFYILWLQFKVHCDDE